MLNLLNSKVIKFIKFMKRQKKGTIILHRFSIVKEFKINFEYVFMHIQN